MTSRFQAPMDKKLIKWLHEHESIQFILKLSGLSLEGIFSNCSLEIPKNYEPGLGWFIIWDPTIFRIKGEHQDLVQTILKFAWSYSGVTTNEHLKAFVECELTKSEAGMKLQALRQQKKDAAKQSREWKELDAWILKKLKSKKKWSAEDLWNALPESYDEEEIYRSGNKIHCRKDSRKPISFRGFCDHVREMRKK
ncbi:hypothetical protein BN1013_00377 [Candidatus Rubidus massiliensis]|nr:hypothetical protein BN1013_00377 [Candidatus Rubidus massiliensis]